MNSTKFTTWFQTKALQHLKQSLKHIDQLINEQIQSCYNTECDLSSKEIPIDYLTFQAENCINSFKINLLAELQQISFTKKFTFDVKEPIDKPTRINTENTLMQKAKITAIANSLHTLPQLAFLDIETDGINVDTANILQIAIIKPIIDPEFETLSYFKTWSTYVRPHKGYSQINNKAFNINHIGNKQLENAIGLEEALMLTAHHLSQTVVVGYNINNFDIPILERFAYRFKILLLYKYTIDLYPATWINKRQKLSDAIKAYNLPSNTNPHDAMADASVCIDLFSEIIERNELPNNEEDLLDTFNTPNNTWHQYGRKHKIINVNLAHVQYSHLLYQTPTSSLKRKLSQTSIPSRSNSFNKK
jgi:DNA polymerase III epsilon subunit-like protein